MQQIVRIPLPKDETIQEQSAPFEARLPAVSTTVIDARRQDGCIAPLAVEAVTALGQNSCRILA
jgi:hypothetical protein